jgi:hypothetical protein
LKKRTKKLLFPEGFDGQGASAHKSESFLLLFFKKEALSPNDGFVASAPNAKIYR